MPNFQLYYSMIPISGQNSLAEGLMMNHKKIYDKFLLIHIFSQVTYQYWFKVMLKKRQGATATNTTLLLTSHPAFSDSLITIHF